MPAPAIHATPSSAMKKARALKLIRRLKAAEGERSDWEGEFLDSVEERLGQYDRAFADPEKGGRDSAVSVRQGAKLREIKAKLSGEPQAAKPQAAKPRSTLARRTPIGQARRPRSAQRPEEEP
jgi:hypothetical protein